ncbi:MAG UNVERIFIED_CONTAM: hypothetical protein LVR29_11350 [Microcystis novacekii LVE1205-3]
MPEFALRYFIRRASDFFDWYSGVYEFPTDKDILEREIRRLVYLDSDIRYLSAIHSPTTTGKVSRN